MLFRYYPDNDCSRRVRVDGDGNLQPHGCTYVVKAAGHDSKPYFLNASDLRNHCIQPSSSLVNPWPEMLFVSLAFLAEEDDSQKYVLHFYEEFVTARCLLDGVSNDITTAVNAKRSYGVIDGSMYKWSDAELYCVALPEDPPRKKESRMERLRSIQNSIVWNDNSDYAGCLYLRNNLLYIYVLLPTRAATMRIL